MFSHLFLIAHAISSFLRQSQAAACNPQVISEPFIGQRLANQGVTRGMSLGLGSPTQQFSVVLCAAHIDSYIYGMNVTCDGKTSTACMTSRGGFYDQMSSSMATAGDPLSHIAENMASRWAKDSAVLSDNFSLPDFDFSLPDKQIHDFRPQAEIGVGINSTFINALQVAGAVSSRSYSLFWGDEFTNQPRDGFVTFGGYDRAIIRGVENVTGEFNRSNPDCAEGMVVVLTEMQLSNERGTLANIFDGLGPLTACVVPSMRNIMALPSLYGDRIIKGMGATRADAFSNGRYGGVLAKTALITPESATFVGNLSMTVEGAIKVAFTAQQLSYDDHYIDSNGFVQANGTMTNVPIIIEPDNPPRMARLGGMFFSSAYLIVNHDKNKFIIAPARTVTGPSDLVGIDTANECSAWPNGTVLETTSTLNKNTSSPDISTLTPSLEDSQLTIGAIVGIAVGAFIGVVLLVGAGFLVWRKEGIRSTSSKHTSNSEALAAEKDAIGLVEASADTLIYEAGCSERHYAAELEVARRPAELR